MTKSLAAQAQELAEAIEASDAEHEAIVTALATSIREELQQRLTETDHNTAIQIRDAVNELGQGIENQLEGCMKLVLKQMADAKEDVITALRSEAESIVANVNGDIVSLKDEVLQALSKHSSDLSERFDMSVAQQALILKDMRESLMAEIKTQTEGDSRCWMSWPPG